jgi:hypothetical protein
MQNCGITLKWLFINYNSDSPCTLFKPQLFSFQGCKEIFLKIAIVFFYLYCICIQAVYSDYILKGLQTVILCIVYKYTNLRLYNELKIFNTVLDFALWVLKYMWVFIVHCTVSAYVYKCICKQNIQNSL